jgi:hypothetical protein
MKQFFSVGITLDYTDGRWYASADYSQLGGHAQPDAVCGTVRAEYGNTDPRVVVQAVKETVERFGIQWGIEGASPLSPFLSYAGEGHEDYEYPLGWLYTLQGIAAELEWETYRQEEDCTC